MIGWRAAQYGNWIVDDAAITFAYARNLAEGLGPVAQPGVPAVEGFSNPTWTALLAIGRLLGLFDRGTLFGIPDYVLFPKALALLCCAGVLVACHVAASLVTRRPWLTTLAAGAALTAVPSFVVWCFSGLENSLFALVVTCLAVVAFRAVLLGRLLSPKVAVAAGLLAAAAALTRPDGAIYAFAYPLIVLVTLRRATITRGIRHLLLSSAAFAVPFGGYVLWRYLEFGRLVANTAVAKDQGVPEVQQLTRAGELVQYAGAPAVLVLMVTVGLAMSRSSWWRDGMIALLVVLGLALLAYAVINPDWMGQYRFATPVWALAAVTGSLAATEALRGTGARGRVVLSIALVVALLPSGVAFAAAGGKFRDTPTLPMCFIADRFGRVFNQYADILGVRQGSILEPDLGGSSLTSRLPIVDLAGLVDGKIADMYHDHDMAALREHVFEDVRPTFIHFRMYWGPATGLSTDPRLFADYEPIYTYPAPADFGGDFVRKDAVHSPEQLAALRAYAAETVPVVETHIYTWPRRTCGDTLEPGQTTVALP
ncbi:hypothetical protein FNH06_25480 [Amycolatopsis acidiphila]|uniref:Glycosyltransferase RgtA/B/C/D-like domain-containing protein n=2 Tax=Amycolatopsis acidiphila TaxID=715473 RepID=A0A558A4G0_9PSEU|nr:hypothetical protein FNH06_25480 [Amycolatopsis acidiphila]